MARRAVRPDPVQEEGRRQQLIDVTLDSLAEEGFSGSTLQVIARRARVSAGLVAHYFGDKDGLLDAAFRSLSRRVADQVRQRLKLAGTPRERIQAVIDGNLAPGEFDRRTGTAWLAFWGQALQSAGLRRIQDFEECVFIAHGPPSLLRSWGRTWQCLLD